MKLYRLYCLGALLTAPIAAQEFRGSILGRVSDPSGAAVAGAAVEAANADTGLVLHTISNESGNYQIPFLPPGNYVVSVAHPGFKKLERRGIRVSVGAQIALDLTLELGATAETVTVTAETPLLNTAGAELGQVIDNAYVGKIAVSLSRNIINLAQLAGGVTSAGTGTYTSNAQSNLSISGGGSTRGRNEFLVDGIPNTVPQGGGLIAFVPSVDSVEEVKVHTTLFDASLGHSNGGAISITTRGGTNEFHGAAYIFKRWSDLNANSWANNRLGLPKPPVDYRQWGYTVGGPVLIPRIYNGRNRTFFSTSLERDADKRDLSLQARVPTELERQGDFSRTINRLGGALNMFDPASTRVTGSTATRTAFAGARIPANRFDPTGSALLRAMPLPNLAGDPQIGKFNWAVAGIYQVDQKQVGARFDHQISERQRVFVRFGRLERIQAADRFFDGLFNAPVGGGDLGLLVRHFYNLGVDDTITLTPTLVASFRYGLARRFTYSSGGGADLDPAKVATPAAIAANQAVRGFPVFNLGENTATIGSSASREANDLHAFLATFTKLAGKHSLKFGIDYRLVRWNRLSPGGAAAGDFTFNAAFTQQDPFTARSADNSGSGMASALLGLPTAGSLGYTSPLSLQNHYLGAFVQEDWKINQRLTLNFGVRYELETPYTERYNRIGYGLDNTAKLPVQPAGFDLRGGILFAGVNGASRAAGRVDRNNFGPRAGFAFRAVKNTVIRGGYGLFFSGQSYNTGFLGDVGAFNAVTPYVGSVDGDATPFTTLANPFPGGLRQPLGSAAGLSAQLGDSLTFFDSRRVSPYNQQWQFSIQRELPGRVLVEAAYAGMLSLKQFENFDLNEKPDRYLAQGAAENTRVPNPFLGVFPATSTLGQGTTIIQRRLWPAYPQFTALNVQGANTGRAVYHALQLKADKRFSRGFSVLWTFTGSKLMDNNTTSIVNERHYRAISLLDQSRVMRLAFIYELPFRFQSRAMRYLAGGWSASGIMTLASGLPLSVTHANGRPLRARNPALGGAISERLGDRRDAAGKVSNPYFDIGAFTPLANQYIISPEPPALAELRAPGQRTLNASLFKMFALRERLKAEIRLESSSLTNTPNFDAPGTNLSNTATFGVITSAGGNRSMQAGARLVF
ncbi:MAG: hypothetical protein EXQ52_12815 [Bryobacterales bacterium]|nr:hypothetical protein [Bryobacterales bacterium]